MIREYTNREVAKIIEDAEETEIRLVPRLMLKNGSASLEFKLGRDRFYIIKDLMAFAEAVRTGAQRILRKAADLSSQPERLCGRGPGALRPSAGAGAGLSGAF